MKNEQNNLSISKSSCRGFMELWGIGLLLTPVFTLLIASVVFWCGGRVQAFMFPLAVVFSIVAIFFVAQKNIKQWLFSSAILVLSIVGFCFLSLLVLDHSFDGQWYHQEMIWKLANGWNPFFAAHAPASDINTGGWKYVNHYSKGLETVAATIYSLTGEIESGKAVNFILIAASGLLFFSFLQRFYNMLSVRKQVFFTLLFLLCPVVLQQSFSFLIDFAMYSLLLMLIPALITFGKTQSRKALLIIVSVVILAVSIKFNVLFWCAFAVLCFCVYWIFTKNFQTLRKVLIATAVSGIVAVGFINYNPYITNTIDHAHPLYPLMGEGKEDIMIGNMPTCLRDKSQITQVLISLVAQPNGYLEWRKTAFQVDKYHFLGRATPRLGGFGGFFLWTMLISVALLVAEAIRQKDFLRNKKRLPYSIFASILFIALFILPSGWWARYVPFFYAFPLVICLYFEKENQTKHTKILCYIIYAMLIINAIATTLAVNRMYTDFKAKIDNIHSVMAQSPKPIKVYFGGNFALKLRTDKAGLPYEKATYDEDKLFGIGLNPAVLFDTAQCEIQNRVLRYRIQD
ncbi:MAG: hypothetical protein FWC39_05360 [Bacteroidetes bacterium]|nr:hypothetical protein [Bacteroidota bacterium]